MEKQDFLETLEKAKEQSKDRNFDETVEFIVNLKDLDLNKPDEQLDFFLTTPNDMKLDRSICALVGPELKDEAEKVCDEVIPQSDFGDFEKKELKKLAKNHDFFVAQANIMPNVASHFGKYLGPRGKMPSPDAGSVVPPNADLKPLYGRLQNTLKVTAKKAPVVQLVLGKEDMNDEKLADNGLYVYNQIRHNLPKEDNNIKEVYLKTTMGKPVKVE